MPLLGLRPGLTGMTENPFLAYRFAAFSLDVLVMITPVLEARRQYGRVDQ